MTTDLFQSSDSPLTVLGLSPSPIALEAQGKALEVSQGGTSFNSGVSSTLGVVGDLGIVGLLVYLGLFLSLFLRLRKETAAEGIAAAGGFAIFLVLGLAFDWWEQPPFGVFLGVLAGLALSAEGHGARGPGLPLGAADSLVWSTSPPPKIRSEAG
jgi:O-antigen ligase